MTSEHNDPASADPASVDPVVEAVDAVDAAATVDEAAVDTTIAPTASAAVAATGAKAVDGGRHRHAVASFLAATGVAALAGAVACLGYFGYVGLNAYFGDAGKVAELRDESVDVAEQAVINISTINGKDLDGWQRQLESSLTGDALKQAHEGAFKDLKERAKAGNLQSEITAKVTGVAATEVNLEENKANVLVFSISTVKDLTGKYQDVSRPLTFLVTVVEADGVRKASVIAPLTGVTDTKGGAGGGAQNSGGSGESGGDQNGQNGGDQNSGTGEAGGGQPEAPAGEAVTPGEGER